MRLLALLKSKRNLLFLYLSQVLSAVLPLVTIPVLTRAMGIEVYGEYVLLQSVILLGLMLVDYGYNLSGTSFVALNKQDPEAVSHKNSVLILNRVFLSFVATLVSAVILFYLDITSFEKFILPLFLIYLGNALFPLWWFQGTENMLSIAVFYTITRAYILIPIVLGDIDITRVFYWQAFMYLGYAIVILLVYKIRILPPRNYRFSLIEGSNQFASSFLSFMYTSSSILMGGLIFSDRDMGGYALADKLVKFMVYTFSPISQVLYPKSAVMLQQDPQKGIRRILKMGGLVFLGYVLVVLVLNVFIEQIIRVISGAEFVDFAYLVHVLSPWVLVFILNNFLGIQILQNVQKEHLYTRVMLVMGCAVVLMNVLIYVLKLPILYLGLGLLIAEGVGFVMLCGMVYRVYGKRGVLDEPAR